MSTGSNFFSWLATVWGRPLRARVPMLWTLGVFFLLAVGLWFTVADFSSLMLGDAGVDRALHDTYYVVALFHYVVSLGAVFAFFAGWYYLFPKLTGFMYSEPLGRLHFWLTFVGASVSFLPQHFLVGAPRHFADYPDGFVANLNWWSSVGSYITLAGFLVFAAAMLYPWLVVRGRHG